MIAITEVKHTKLETFGRPGFFPGELKVLEELPPADMDLLEKVFSEPVEFVDHPMFHDAATRDQIEQSFDGPGPDLKASEAQLLPMDLFTTPDRTRAAFKPLTADQENHLFIKLNYARYRIRRLVKSRCTKPITMAFAREVLRWRKRELTVRSQITQANLPLVLGMAKRAKANQVEFAELIGEGNMALVRSVDKFDCARGFKFSTYACRSILKSFARIALRTNRYRARFPVEFDPALEKGSHLAQCREATRVHCLDHLREAILHPEANGALSEIEKRVLRTRFGIHATPGAAEPLTLEKVGEILGLTKERIRQIQNKALRKLKTALEDHVLAG